MKYLAYFQAYTNTYAEIEQLKSMYTEALAVDDVVGIIIGTRPDCMPDNLLDYLQDLAKSNFVLIEYGAETANDNTLSTINRGHSWNDTVDAVTRTAAKGLLCGLHFIVGLPGEDTNDFIYSIKQASKLPISTIKLHQLQLIKGTKLAKQVADNELKVCSWNANEYIDICLSLISNLSPTIAIERFVSQSPESLLISPRWGLKNYEFTNLLNNKIKKTSTTQGSECQ